MTKSHRHYEFGTFNERLEHLCMLFEIAPPEIVYEDGEPTLTDGFMDWIKANEVNMDWLFVGSPCAVLRAWAKDRIREQEDVKTLTRMDEVEKTLLVLALRARLEQGVPLDQALDAFAIAVKEHRANKALADDAMQGVTAEIESIEAERDQSVAAGCSCRQPQS